MITQEEDTLPFDIDIEQALLGSLMIDNAWLDRISTSLTPEHLYDPLHQRLYGAIEAIWSEGGAATPLTIKGKLDGDEGFKAVGGYAYLVSLAKAAPPRPNVQDYARILVELATKRQLIRVGEDLISGAIDKEEPLKASELMEFAEKALYQVAEKSRFGSEPLSFDDVITLSLKKTEQALARNGTLAGVPSGLPDLDKLLGGFQASDLIIVAGRPGMGKTSLATNMSFHAASKGRNVLLFSLEMGASQLGHRIIAEQSGIEMWKLRLGRLTDEEWDEVVGFSQNLRQLPLRIDDTGGISLAQLTARARRRKRQKKLDMIVVDYLQLVTTGKGKRFENRTQEVSDITAGLKSLAKELDVPVIALSQLSRGVDNREDKRPVLSDLRESGSIEQDADIVMFVYREEFYLKHREPDPMTPEYSKWDEKMRQVAGKAEILVEKHRNGPTNRINLFFNDKLTKFYCVQ